MATPEHGRRRGEKRRRSRRRHGRDRQAGSSSSSASRRRHDGEAERDARRRRRDNGSANASPPHAKRPRLQSEAADSVAMAAAPMSPVVTPADKCIGAALAPEAAPAKGGAGTASSSTSTAAPPATTTGVLYACQLSVPPPPLPFSQGARQAMAFTGAAQPLPMPAYAPCPKRMKPAIPSASRPAYVIPAIPRFPIIVQGQQDTDELRRAALRERFAGLIAKSVEEKAENYGKLLRSGKAPSEPEPEPPTPIVDDEVTLRQMAELDAARKRSREALAREERKARGAALFVQMARPEHLRALGIDKAMECVVSPDRPRNGNGAPVLSSEHPCSPLEKLGYFLKPEY